MCVSVFAHTCTHHVVGSIPRLVLMAFSSLLLPPYLLRSLVFFGIPLCVSVACAMHEVIFCVYGLSVLSGYNWTWLYLVDISVLMFIIQLNWFCNYLIFCMWFIKITSVII